MQYIYHKIQYSYKSPYNPTPNKINPKKTHRKLSPKFPLYPPNLPQSPVPPSPTPQMEENTKTKVKQDHSIIN